MKAVRPLLLGAIAGVAGTVAITACQAAAAKWRGESASTEVPETWDEAPAPAQVAKQATTAVGADLLERKHVPLVTNVMHWLYGISWGALYGLAADQLRPKPLQGGLALSTWIWGLQYAELVPLGISEPPWKQAPKELVLDASFHAVYGATVAAAYAALEAARAA